MATLSVDSLDNNDPKRKKEYSFFSLLLILNPGAYELNHADLDMWVEAVYLLNIFISYTT